MTTDCRNCPLRKLNTFAAFNEADLTFMNKFKVGELSVDAGTPILMEGSSSPQLFTTLSGMGLRHKTLENGRRQVLNLVFPGDFIGLQAGLMGEMSHSVEATTAMTLCVFDRNELWNLFRANPGRGFALTWLAAVEEHFLGEALTTVGQRSALEAVSWALVRIFQRGTSLGLSRGGSMVLPYRQQDLADTLGLSLVHTNKTLTKLRERGVAAWHDGVLVIDDLDGLAAVAGMELSEPPTRPLI